MASGFDARVGIATEVTYGTRVAPARYLALTAEDLGFTVNRYFSPAIGTGMWGRPSVVTSKVGSGSLRGDVPTVGFGYLVNSLHGNTVTPVQQASTIAYLQTHTLDSPPSRSYSIQVQTPPVTSATLIPHDMLGVMLSGVTFSWSAEGVLSYNFPAIVRNIDITQSNAAYTAPAAYTLFPYMGGAVTIGGVAEAGIVGDGSFALEYSLRQAYELGTSGLIAKPVLTDKPRASGTFSADFNSNANLSRALDNTIADVVLTFTGPLIVGSHYSEITITFPDCVFTTGRGTVDGPGPVGQTVSFESASATGDPPIITIKSTEVAL